MRGRDGRGALLTAWGGVIVFWSEKGLSKIADEFEMDQVVEGKVTRILPYGAMVELREGVSGLLHISQIAEAYVRDVSEHLHLGDVVRAKIVGIKEPGKYQLSIKALTGGGGSGGGGGGGERRGGSRELEDKIAQFMKESQRRQAELKRSRDPRRGKRR